MKGNWNQGLENELRRREESCDDDEEIGDL